LGKKKKKFKINKLPSDFEKWERRTFLKVITEELTEDQKATIRQPPETFPLEKNVLAVHWHPEFIPLDLVRERVDNTFPNMKKELIIPTQHNEIMTMNGYSGVEVDCYSKEFNRKVQLLIHFKDLDLEKAGVMISMLDHTFRYRSRQLFELINTLISEEMEERRMEAIVETGVDDDLLRFVTYHTEKILHMIKENEQIIPKRSIKNKLLRNYFNELREFYDDRMIDHAQVYIKTVKKIVKKHFDLSYFYTTEEIIKEARELNAGIIIPHPEQFWPVLLADYDVDGYEVWNPQSREFTDFLVKVLLKK
jgi:hypothetical protein